MSSWPAPRSASNFPKEERDKFRPGMDHTQGRPYRGALGSVQDRRTHRAGRGRTGRGYHLSQGRSGSGSTSESARVTSGSRAGKAVQVKSCLTGRLRTSVKPRIPRKPRRTSAGIVATVLFHVVYPFTGQTVMDLAPARWARLAAWSMRVSRPVWCPQGGSLYP